MNEYPLPCKPTGVDAQLDVVEANLASVLVDCSVHSAPPPYHDPLLHVEATLAEFTPLVQFYLSSSGASSSTHAPVTSPPLFHPSIAPYVPPRCMYAESYTQSNLGSSSSAAYPGSVPDLSLAPAQFSLPAPGRAYPPATSLPARHDLDRRQKRTAAARDGEGLGYLRRQRRRLLSNHESLRTLLQAGVQSAADLNASGRRCLSRSEVIGKHGHSANLMLRGTPSVVITARYAPPAAARETSKLVSVTLVLRPTNRARRGSQQTEGTEGSAHAGNNERGGDDEPAGDEERGGDDGRLEGRGRVGSANCVGNGDRVGFGERAGNAARVGTFERAGSGDRSGSGERAGGSESAGGGERAGGDEREGGGERAGRSGRAGSGESAGSGDRVGSDERPGNFERVESGGGSSNGAEGRQIAVGAEAVRSKFVLLCSCMSPVDSVEIEGRELSAIGLHGGDDEQCDHVKVVVGELSGTVTGISQLGARLAALLSDSSAISSESTEAFVRKREALAFSISASKVYGEVVAVVWNGEYPRRGASPVLVLLTKRIREDKIRPRIRCAAVFCVSDNFRPPCTHEKCCATNDEVKQFAASEEKRLQKGSVGGTPVDLGESVEADGLSIIETGHASSDSDSAAKDNTTNFGGEVGDGRANRAINGAQMASRAENQSVGGFASSRTSNPEDPKHRFFAVSFDPKHPYRSRARRAPQPCLSDITAIPLRSTAVREEGLNTTLVDEEGQCRNILCRRDTCPLDEPAAGTRSVALMQWSGTHLVNVRDWRCSACGTINRFEGRDTATFCMTRSLIYDRAVLDWLISNTLRSCGTGRCAYMDMISARHAAADAFGGAVRARESNEVSDPDRRAVSEALACFVATLGDMPGNPGSLKNIFHCNSECDAESIVVDGSAVGILEALPDFESDSVEVKGMSTKNNSLQHLLREQHAREGVRHLLRLVMLSETRASQLEVSLMSSKSTANESNSARVGAEADASSFGEDGDDGGSAVSLSKLAKKTGDVKPVTRRAREKAVVGLVMPFGRGGVRDRNSPAALRLNESCRAPGLSENALEDELTAEAKVLETLSAEAVGVALKDALVFSDEGSITPVNASTTLLASTASHLPSTHPQPNQSTALPAQILSALPTQVQPVNSTPTIPPALTSPHSNSQALASARTALSSLAPPAANAAHSISSALASAPFSGRTTASTPAPSTRHLTEPTPAHSHAPSSTPVSDPASASAFYDGYALTPTAPVARRRGGVDVTLLAAYLTLLIVLLSDPISAVWGRCDNETLLWMRNLCFLLSEISLCSSLVMAKRQIYAIRRVAHQGRGQCPSLLRFVQSLCGTVSCMPDSCLVGRWSPPLLLAQSAARLCLLALRQCRVFDRVGVLRASESSAAYAKEHEDGRRRWSLPWTMDEGRRCGHMYPGRHPVRPGVFFSDCTGKACSKEYVASKGPSPGVIVVTCACGNKAVLGFSLLLRAESLSIIATILLRYFPGVKTAYYDNACNFFMALLSRFPWLTAIVTLLVDVFHKIGHTCGVTFCTRTQSERNGVRPDARTSNAESANKQLSAIRSSFLRVRPSNAMAFLTMRFFFINLLSRWRSETGVDDTEDADLVALCNRLMTCKCGRCIAGRADQGELGAAFARGEAELHESLFKRGPSTRGASARHASAAVVEAQIAEDRARAQRIFGDRRLIGSLGGRVRPRR